MAILKCNTNKFSGGQAQMIKYLPRPREKNKFLRSQNKVNSGPFLVQGESRGSAGKSHHLFYTNIVLGI